MQTEDRKEGSPNRQVPLSVYPDCYFNSTPKCELSTCTDTWGQVSCTEREQISDKGKGVKRTLPPGWQRARQRETSVRRRKAENPGAGPGRRCHVLQTLVERTLERARE